MTSQPVASSSHGSTPATLPPDTPLVRPRELLLGGGSGSTVGHSTASTQGLVPTSQQTKASSTHWDSNTIDDRDYNRAAFNAKQSLLNLSTQFRHWRFSFEHLDKIRADLNTVAVAALRDAGAGGDVRASYLFSFPMFPTRIDERILPLHNSSLASCLSLMFSRSILLLTSPRFPYQSDIGRQFLDTCQRRNCERKSRKYSIPDSCR